MTAETTDRAALVAKHVAEFEALRDKLIHALDLHGDTSFVLGWDNGLCLGETDDGVFFATSVLNAADAEDIHQTATNGNGERATRRRRQEVIAQELERILATIEEFKALA